MFQAIRSTMMFRFITVVGIVGALFIAAQIYQTQASLAAGNIVMYTDNVGHNGNLGGRAGADAICAGMAGKPSGFAKYKAFISVDAADTIANMPANYGISTTDPIVGPTGTAIGTNWNDLLDESIANNLQTAIGVTGFYWTGSNADGSLDGTNCSGWTTTEEEEGMAGDESETGDRWLNVGEGMSCDSSLALVCIAYGTPAAVGGVAEVIAMPTASTNGLGYLAGLAGVVMLVGAGWLVKQAIGVE